MRKATNAASATKRLVIAAILSALSFVAMYVGSLTGVMDLCAAVVGSLCTAFAVIELRGMWPWLVCCVCSVLCLLLLPDKFMALEYMALGGIYPILKSLFESLPKIPCLTAKLISANILLTACLFAGKFILGIQEDWLVFSPLVYLLANGFFLFFDYALTVFIGYYMNRLRGRLRISNIL